MKANPTQQRILLELAEIDAEMARLAHRAANLAEQHRCDELEAEHRAATDRIAVVGIAIEDLDAQVQRLESEIDGVRQREDRDRRLLDSAETPAKQVAELQHELETLQRRQSTLEDSELELMERREQLQSEQSGEQSGIDALAEQLSAAQLARNAVLADIEQTRDVRTARRVAVGETLDAELVALYERAGAGPLQGRRCGACNMEIDRGEMSRIAAAADDDVLRCPECGAILLRTSGFGA